MTKLERFEDKYFINIYNGCFEWIAAKDLKGYGSFQGQAAHRQAIRLYRGIEPGEMHVCHHCDNPSCVNPEHLFVGTRSDNMRDMVKKGRMNKSQLMKLKASRCSFSFGNVPRNTKLSVEDVEYIRSMRGTCYKILVRKFNVCKQTIHKIWNGTWRKNARAIQKGI